MKRYVLPLCFCFPLVASCGDQKTMPFLGQWDGEFTVDKVLQGADTPKDRARHRLKGYVKIVLNQKGYLLHLQGEQQVIDVKGSWTYNGRQLVLDPVDVKVETEGKDDGPNPNYKYVASDELYVAYQKKLTFNLSKDGKEIKGLTMSIATLEGTHNFKKE